MKIKKEEWRVSQLPSGQAGPWGTRRCRSCEPLCVSHLCQVGHHPEHLVHHQHNKNWSRPSDAIFDKLEVPCPTYSQAWIFLVVLSLSEAPLWWYSWNQGTGESPHPPQNIHSIEFRLGGIGRRGGARGEGGAEDQWWREKSFQDGGAPLLKTFTRRGGDRSFSQKVKASVSLPISACNTS